MKNYQKYIDGSILIVTIFTLSKFFYQVLYIQITMCPYVKFIKKLKTTEMSLEATAFHQ